MMPSDEPSFSDMLVGGCNWRNRSELLGVLMRWSPNTTGGSRFFVTEAEYRVCLVVTGMGRTLSMLPRRPRSHRFLQRVIHVIPAIPACPVRPQVSVRACRTSPRKHSHLPQAFVPRRWVTGARRPARHSVPRASLVIVRAISIL